VQSSRQPSEENYVLLHHSSLEVSTNCYTCYVGAWVGLKNRPLQPRRGHKWDIYSWWAKLMPNPKRMLETRVDTVIQHTSACCSTQVVDIKEIIHRSTSITSIRVSRKHCPRHVYIITTQTLYKRSTQPPNYS
jgi:hypothetical protein